MPEVADTIDPYLSMFERFEKQRGRGAWLMHMRKAAISRFAELGFPTTDDEEWRYTNVTPIAGAAFASPPDITRSAKQLLGFLDDSAALRLVVVNGRFAPELSALNALPSGVRLSGLCDAIEQEDETVRTHLARHAPYEDHAFTALNTALMEDGAFLEVARGAVIERPIHIIYVSTPGPTTWMANPRNLIVAGANSEVTIVESYVAPELFVYFNNAVTEIVAMDGAIIDHYKITRESDAAYHIGALQLNQCRSSNVHSFAGSFGGGLVRHNIHTLLDGEGSDCGLNGLYMVDGSRHVDNHLVVDHAEPHCNSREFFKGVLSGKGKGIFSGRIVVRPDAQKTDAKQTNMSLLMSQDAQVESKPQLEIFADDVKCTHGATIGQVSDDAVFYLRSRGMAEKDARGMLVHAFAGEVLDRVKVEPLRAQLESLVVERLSHADQPKDVA